MDVHILLWYHFDFLRAYVIWGGILLGFGFCIILVCFLLCLNAYRILAQKNKLPQTLSQVGKLKILYVFLQTSIEAFIIHWVINVNCVVLSQLKEKCQFRRRRKLKAKEEIERISEGEMMMRITTMVVII